MLLLSSQFAAFSEKLDQIAALPKYDRLSTNNYNVDSRAIVMQPTSFEENIRLKLISLDVHLSPPGRGEASALHDGSDAC